MHDAERFTVPFAYHGEGPFWDPRSRRLLCMDLLASTIVAVDSDGNLCRYPVPGRASTVIRRREGTGFVVATEHGVVVTNDELTTFDPIARVVSDESVRTNDGGCDPLGGFVIGTMSYNERRRKAAVYRIASGDEKATVILSPVSISNGVQWSADGKRVYYIDTPTKRVDVFDFDLLTGRWCNRRMHIQLEGAGGFPDGLAIDEEDGLWVALWGAGEVRHYDNTGRHVESIRVPGVTQVSSCAFGGDDLRELFITTSRKNLAHSEEPDAGGIFIASTSVKGAPVIEFAG